MHTLFRISVSSSGTGTAYAKSMAEILIVDDDRDIVELTRQVVSFEGHTSRQAYNGQEGLEKMREKLPDLILLDVEMPVLDGPSMAYRIIIHDAGHERVPIVLLSGAEKIYLIARRIGTPYFLPKPYSLDAFIQLINRALLERIAPAPAAAPTVGAGPQDK